MIVSSSISTSIRGNPGEARLHGLVRVGVAVGGGEVQVGTGVLVRAGWESVGMLVKVSVGEGSVSGVGTRVLISSTGLKLGVAKKFSAFSGIPLQAANIKTNRTPGKKTAKKKWKFVLIDFRDR
jgi:hypothetical protein